MTKSVKISIDRRFKDAKAFVRYLNSKGFDACSHEHTGHFLNGSWIIGNKILEPQFTELLNAFKGNQSPELRLAR